MGLCFLPPTKNFTISSPTKVIEYLSMKIPVLINKEIIDQENIVSLVTVAYSLNTMKERLQ